jgi:hypothetical protein
MQRGGALVNYSNLMPRQLNPHSDTLCLMTSVLSSKVAAYGSF